MFELPETSELLPFKALMKPCEAGVGMTGGSLWGAVGEVGEEVLACEALLDTSSKFLWALWFFMA